MSSNRRNFFKQTGLLAAGVVGFPAVVRSADVAAVAPGSRPRNIIHLVADGMSSGTLTAADYYSHFTRQRGLSWFDFAHRPGTHSAFVNMRSLNSFVTDSSAASSSWGSGSRVMNGALNQLPDGRNLRTLYQLFDELHWRRGLVTTTEITHATPAGFATNSASRGSADELAVQYLDRRVDVLLGGGKPFFDAGKRKDKRDLYADYRAAGYTVMTKAAELKAAPLDARWLGTFSSGHLPYTVDRDQDVRLLKEVPSLATMTRLALGNLGRADHFILQVEGGRVDHGAHANDIAASVGDMIAFDEALDVCLEFQARVPETLVVVTTDHGTANAGLNGSGSNYKDSPTLFANVLRVKASFEKMEGDLKKPGTAAGIQKVLLKQTGYRVPDAKAALLARVLEKKADVMYDGMSSLSQQLGQLMANYLGVGFTGGAHTADYMPLLAAGPGSERFRGFRQNVEVFRNYVDLVGIDYRNPEAPLVAESGPSADEVEFAARLA